MELKADNFILKSETSQHQGSEYNLKNYSQNTVYALNHLTGLDLTWSNAGEEIFDIIGQIHGIRNHTYSSIDYKITKNSLNHKIVAIVFQYVSGNITTTIRIEIFDT